MARRRKRLVGIAVLLFVGGVLAASVHPEIPAAELEARFATPPSRFIEVDGLRIHLGLKNLLGSGRADLTPPGRRGDFALNLHGVPQARGDEGDAALAGLGG